MIHHFWNHTLLSSQRPLILVVRGGVKQPLDQLAQTVLHASGVDTQKLQFAPPQIANRRGLNSRWQSTNGKGLGGRNDSPSFSELVSRAQAERSKISSSEQHNSRSNKRTRMRDLETIDEGIEMTFDQLQKEKLSQSDIAAFWSNIPRWLRSRSKRNFNQTNLTKLETIANYTSKASKSFEPRYLAETVLGMARIAEAFATWDRNRRNNYRFYQVLRNVLSLDNPNQKHSIFNKIAVSSSESLSKFEPRQLSNLAYAYFKIGFVPRFDGGKSLFDHIAAESILQIKDFNGQNISNLVYAYARLGELNETLFTRIGDAVVASGCLEDFVPQALSNTVWSFASIGMPHPGLFEKVAHHIVSLSSLHSFSPQALANIVWAFAKLEVSHPALFEKVARHVGMLNSLHSFDEQNLANILWAFAKLEASHRDLFQKVGDHIASLDTLDSFFPQGLSNIVWAYATANIDRPKLLEKIAAAIVEKNDLDSFDLQHISNIAWSFATLGYYSPQLFDKLANAVIKQQAKFSSQEISIFLWALAMVGCIERDVFSSLAPAVEKALPNCNCQDLANIGWAFAVSNVQSSIFDRNGLFLKACIDAQDEFTLEDLRQLYQWHLWQKETNSDVILRASLEKRCYRAFAKENFTISNMQKDVVKELKAIGLKIEEEVLMGSGYRIDVIVEVDGMKVAVEVDGPSHFNGKNPTGSTILKRRQISSLDDVPLVSIPYWEWDQCGNSRKRRQQYLRSKLCEKCKIPA